MPRLSRRALLVGSASLAAAPAFGAASWSRYVDVVIVGTGAAGIAAGRRLAAAGRRFVLLEAADRIGGRCITDTRTFGVPYDRGAHWIHMPDINPLAKLAGAAKLDVYPAPPGQKLRIGRRFAREGEMEDFLSALVRANRAIGEAARGKNDVSCAQALPKDLLDLRPAVEFLLGPFGCSKDLNEVSAGDFAKGGERDLAAFCRQGLGTLVAKLGEALPVQLGTPVTAINWSPRESLEIDTPRGRVGASAVIVTASTGVLAAAKIRFNPPLPRRQLDAIAKLSLGSYDHIALELEGNPLGLQNDELVFEKATSNRTAALLANVSGRPLCLVEVGGRFGAGLAAQGEAAMVAFAVDWLGDLYGADVKKAVRRKHATNWAKEPWALGAFSAAQVGGQPSRRILMEPLANRVYFAGEAVHETQWGTLGGAWDSGERAAEAVLKRFAPQPARPTRPSRSRRS
ncbi:MAG: flavin monoamine oxidase family protein [Xanthobacteraceae bacterium]|jgi:monoamine oxidase